MGTFKEPLNAWINPVLDAATSGDDFLLTDLRKKRMTIYIGIQPEQAGRKPPDREPVLQPGHQSQHRASCRTATRN